MRFVCQQKQLLNSINIVQKALSSKTTLPILRGIYLESYDNKLKLMATDLELGIEHLIEVESHGEGAIVLDARLFNDIVRKLPDSEVKIELKENNQIHIECENSKFNIIGHDPRDFPELPSIEGGTSYKISQDLFKNMIRQTIFATSQDESRPVLTGILLEIEENNLSLVALDGYRLALRKGKLEANGDNKIIIPSKTLYEINRIIHQDEESLEMTVTKNHVLFTMDNIKIVSRLLEGEFINYKQILPKNYKTNIKVKTQDLLNSIERAALVAREGRNNLIKLNIEDNMIVIRSNSELGTVYEEVFIESQGDSLEIAFNSRYLIDALRVIDEEEIFLEFTTNLSPGIIKPISNHNYIYLVLPVRLSAN
mgnify:CR=1 FL=1